MAERLYVERTGKYRVEVASTDWWEVYFNCTDPLRISRPKVKEVIR